MGVKILPKQTSKDDGQLHRPRSESPMAVSDGLEVGSQWDDAVNDESCSDVRV